MTLNIRNPEAERLARNLARIDDISITDAVIVALRETIRTRLKAETEQSRESLPPPLTPPLNGEGELPPGSPSPLRGGVRGGGQPGQTSRAIAPRHETPSETAKRLLAKHGLSFNPDRKPAPRSVYHDMDHDLTGED